MVKRIFFPGTKDGIAASLELAYELFETKCVPCAQYYTDIYHLDRFFNETPGALPMGNSKWLGDRAQIMKNMYSSNFNLFRRIILMRLTNNKFLDEYYAFNKVAALQEKTEYEQAVHKYQSLAYSLRLPEAWDILYERLKHIEPLPELRYSLDLPGSTLPWSPEA